MVKRVLKEPKIEMKNTEISIQTIILILTESFKIIIVSPIISICICFLYLEFISIPKYSSDSRIVAVSGSSDTRMSGLASQFGISLGGQKDLNQMYPAIIKSRTLAEMVLNREIYSAKIDTLAKLYLILNIDEENRITSKNINYLKSRAKRKLNKMIRLREDLKTGIITILVTSEKPDLSFKINKIIIEELELHQKSYNKNKLKEKKEFIQSRIYETEKELNLSEQKLKRFRERNRQINNSPNLLLEEEKIEREVSVLTGVFTTLKQQYETSKIEELKESNYIMVIDQPELPRGPSSPNERFLYTVYIIVGVVLACSYILIQALFRTNNRSGFDEVWLAEAKSNIKKNVKQLNPFS